MGQASIVAERLSLAALAVAVFVGNRAAKHVDPERTKRIAAVVFPIIGVLLLVVVI